MQAIARVPLDEPNAPERAITQVRPYLFGSGVSAVARKLARQEEIAAIRTLLPSDNRQFGIAVADARKNCCDPRGCESSLNINEGTTSTNWWQLAMIAD